MGMVVFMYYSLYRLVKHVPKVKESKGSPYSITERRVPELILVLGSQSAGDVNHKPDGRLPWLFDQACSCPRNP